MVVVENGVDGRGREEGCPHTTTAVPRVYPPKSATAYITRVAIDEVCSRGRSPEKGVLGCLVVGAVEYRKCNLTPEYLFWALLPFADEGDGLNMIATMAPPSQLALVGTTRYSPPDFLSPHFGM
jgi:hypothetical protein